jgi:hypothetical protein
MFVPIRTNNKNWVMSIDTENGCKSSDSSVHHLKLRVAAEHSFSMLQLNINTWLVEVFFSSAGLPFLSYYFAMKLEYSLFAVFTASFALPLARTLPLNEDGLEVYRTGELSYQ